MPIRKTEIFRVGRIRTDRDRVLLYKEDDPSGYHAIASLKDGDRIKIGNTIKCSAGGINFGWFMKKLIRMKNKYRRRKKKK